MKNIIVFCFLFFFYLKFFSFFFRLKFSIYLNRRVFVMTTKCAILLQMYGKLVVLFVKVQGNWTRHDGLASYPALLIKV